jgi:hypothetical protein
MPHITKKTALKKHIPKDSLQTIIINKDINLNDAINWLSYHNYNFDDIRETQNSYRFLQTNPIIDAKFYSKRITPEITLVYQIYK